MDLKEFPVLYVDDEEDNLDVFRFNYRRIFNIHTASSGEEALSLVEKKDFAVVITDQRMPKMTGLDFLARVKEIKAETLGIILTAYRDPDVLIDAIRLGSVYRFLTKPFNSEELKAAITQAIEVWHLKRKNQELERKLSEYTHYLDNQVHAQYDFGNIIGSSKSLLKVLDNIEKVAPTSSTVLLRGETGTGKELIAHAIHLNSNRAADPFVRVNCAALASGILESELFGHERGAFTGAVSRRMGRFEMADRGTLFLDEVGDLPMDIQVKLLRVLQEREFERVGGEETIKVDVRLISATHKNLEDLVSKGLFRQDLYYRLNVFPLELPPLRERRDDIRELVNHFVEKYSTVTGKLVRKVEQEFFRALDSYDWPGNVRELENLIERAMILSTDGILSMKDLRFGPGFEMPAISTSRTTLALDSEINETEKSRIIRAVEECRGNMAQTARKLGINRTTLYYRMKKHNLEYLQNAKWQG
ncbi:sigma-54 dependent transcriptional regulator [Myxococcota bacterium]|nr:sigma-54 dependent transcriptional regulator [Myxococcota bacterium]MBU1379200.1 sigma-54 dependent transcriptional regulator [Myxococcota bacterium]MBU1496229.1 sigma-54 dependent transcriptional regulator [Myxococcota bacterium]